MPKSKNRKKKGFAPSPLSAHKRDGKVLQTPLNQFGNLQFSSWVNEVLPEMLWAALVVNAVPRKEYLAKFKALIDCIEKNQEKFKDHRLDHTSLSLIEADTFDGLFADLFKDESVSGALSCSLIENLPGLERWEKHLKAPENDDGRIQDAIAASYDHVGEKATDIRWLRVMVEIVRGKFNFAPEMAERFKLIVDFPDSKYQEKDGGPVRALEMATRGNVEGGKSSAWSETFWKMALERTGCVPSNPDKDRKVAKYEELGKEVIELYEQLIKHFMTTIESTVSDPRHEGAFGLTFYIMHLAFLALNASVGQTVQGRLV
ncbi:MAG: hypothetical protein QOH67_4630, partial [Hyphomicrobiales bacterium]|nr:hypothetical protein [Hyphomicrobiales bacterium]